MRTGLFACAIMAMSSTYAEGFFAPEKSSLFEKHVDAASGMVSYLLKQNLVECPKGHPAFHEQTLYFTQKSLTDDGRFLVFDVSGDERSPLDCSKQTALADLREGKVSLLEGVETIPYVDSRRNRLYYAKQGKGFVYRDLAADPQMEHFLCPVPAELIPTNTACRAWLYSHLVIADDGRTAFLDARIDGVFVQGTIDLETGRYEKWGTANFWCNHGQINPKDPHLALAAWEFAWFAEPLLDEKDIPKMKMRPRGPDAEPYPRLWLMRPGGRYEMVKAREKNAASHETWDADGKGFYWCGDGVWHHDLATGRQECWCPLVAKHAKASGDGRRVVFDDGLDGWRGKAFRVGFWNRDSARGIYFHSYMPAMMPQDRPSDLHPDPHPLFVCDDRYVLCTFWDDDARMRISLTPVDQLVAATAAKDAPAPVPCVVPLEWHRGRKAEAPVEVTLDRRKLMRLAGIARDSGFAVQAVRNGLRETLPVTLLNGLGTDQTILRFVVPDGTDSLALEAGLPSYPVRDSVDVDNICAGALSRNNAKRWIHSRPVEKTFTEKGLRLKGGVLDNSTYVVCTMDVPENAAGRPVRLELDVTNMGQSASGNRIFVRQLDAAEQLLPEPVVDPRWTSQVRPQGKLCEIRESGRLHPLARKIRLVVVLEWTKTDFDTEGLPMADTSYSRPDLLISRFVVRPAEELPFPRLSTASFAPGRSGACGDSSLHFTGENAFFFATRSLASYSCGEQLKDEKDIFFPTGAGTVEAFFRPNLDAAETNAVALFEGSHHQSFNEPTGVMCWVRGVLFGLDYVPASKTLKLTMLDDADVRFSAEARYKLRNKAWTHLAVSWVPGEEARVYADGRKVLSMPLKGFKAIDLGAWKRPNSRGPVEFFLGGNFRSARVNPVPLPGKPLYRGDADSLRISSVSRYNTEFTPPSSFACDADTRALFEFNHSYDGISGGGAKFISGSWRALHGRVDGRLFVGDRRVDYYPMQNPSWNDPAKALSTTVYTNMPTVAQFTSARRTVQKTFEVPVGGKITLECPAQTYPDFAEIENLSDVPLRYPALLNAGEVDARSLSDCRAALSGGHMTDRQLADKVFDFVLGGMNFFMAHKTYFAPGSDKGSVISWRPMQLLNCYCGGQCGYLNTIVVQLLVGAGLPASRTVGYGHGFGQVYYGGRTHIVDISGRTFFPSFDNESIAGLDEAEREIGVFNRVGNSGDHFVRMAGKRVPYAHAYPNPEKIGVVLNPGERFRAWTANNGVCNDLETWPHYCGERRTWDRPLKPWGVLFERETGATPSTEKSYSDVWRIDRFIPHYANGFISFAARPTAANPAFAEVTPTSFCYRVASGYPVVAGVYSARLADGRTLPLSISTDYGRTFRPMPAPDADGAVRVDYLVRARHEYLVRVSAPMADVLRFTAETEVEFNPRTFPGRLHGGRNEFTLRAVGSGSARVTLRYREDAHRIAVAGGAFAGTIPGYERQLLLVDPDKASTFTVDGASPAARAMAHGDLEAELKDGVLTLSRARNAKRRQFVASVDIVDGDAVRSLAVLVSPNARLAMAADAAIFGGARRMPAGADAVQESVSLSHKNGADRVEFRFEQLPKGRYAFFRLERFAAYPRLGHTSGYAACTAIIRQKDATGTRKAGAVDNLSSDFFGADYGVRGGRARWKWGFVDDPDTEYPYGMIGVFDMPAFDRVGYELIEDVFEGVEIAAVLIVPDPDRELRCELKKLLCGLNYEPWRVRAD